MALGNVFCSVFVVDFVVKAERQTIFSASLVCDLAGAVFATAYETLYLPFSWIFMGLP